MWSIHGNRMTLLRWACSPLHSLPCFTDVLVQAGPQWLHRRVLQLRYQKPPQQVLGTPPSKASQTCWGKPARRWQWNCSIPTFEATQRAALCALAAQSHKAGSSPKPTAAKGCRHPRPTATKSCQRPRPSATKATSSKSRPAAGLLEMRWLASTNAKM